MLYYVELHRVADCFNSNKWFVAINGLEFHLSFVIVSLCFWLLLIFQGSFNHFGKPDITWQHYFCLLEFLLNVTWITIPLLYARTCEALGSYLVTKKLPKKNYLYPNHDYFLKNDSFFTQLHIFRYLHHSLFINVLT